MPKDDLQRPPQVGTETHQHYQKRPVNPKIDPHKRPIIFWFDVSTSPKRRPAKVTFLKRLVCRVFV